MERLSPSPVGSDAHDTPEGKQSMFATESGRPGRRRIAVPACLFLNRWRTHPVFLFTAIFISSKEACSSSETSEGKGGMTNDRGNRITVMCACVCACVCTCTCLDEGLVVSERAGCSNSCPWSSDLSSYRCRVTALPSPPDCILKD